MYDVELELLLAHRRRRRRRGSTSRRARACRLHRARHVDHRLHVVAERLALAAASVPAMLFAMSAISVGAFVHRLPASAFAARPCSGRAPSLRRAFGPAAATAGNTHERHHHASRTCVIFESPSEKCAHYTQGVDGSHRRGCLAPAFRVALCGLCGSGPRQRGHPPVATRPRRRSSHHLDDPDVEPTSRVDEAALDRLDAAARPARRCGSDRADRRRLGGQARRDSRRQPIDALAIALLHGGNFTCATPPPACGDAARSMSLRPRRRPTFADPCLRRLLALWSIDAARRTTSCRHAMRCARSSRCRRRSRSSSAHAIKADPRSGSGRAARAARDRRMHAGQRELVNGLRRPISTSRT